MTEKELKRLRDLDSRFTSLSVEETDEWQRLMKKYHQSHILMM